jgi:hypothetical protein
MNTETTTEEKPTETEEQRTARIEREERERVAKYEEEKRQSEAAKKALEDEYDAITEECHGLWAELHALHLQDSDFCTIAMELDLDARVKIVGVGSDGPVLDYPNATVITAAKAAWRAVYENRKKMTVKRTQADERCGEWMVVAKKMNSAKNIFVSNPWMAVLGGTLGWMGLLGAYALGFGKKQTP